MRQLIARIDDELHAELKARAAAEGRSLNDLVTELLEAGVDGEDRTAALRRRLAKAGRLVTPPAPKRVPTWEEVERAGRGAGSAVSEALEEDRNAR